MRIIPHLRWCTSKVSGGFEEVVSREKSNFIPTSHISQKAVAERIDECVPQSMRQRALVNKNLETLRDDLLRLNAEIARKNRQTQWGGRSIASSGQIALPTITGDEGDLVYAQIAFVSDLVSWVEQKIDTINRTIDAYQHDAVALYPVNRDNPDIGILDHAQIISDETAKSLQDLLDEECEFEY